ncbi:MAG: toll/interleukin-1 receptor domain-containing protein [Bacteroidota bacterium]
MNRPKVFKYDVALSFSSLDLEIAQVITKEFEKLNITYYEFSENETWGVNIKEETWRVYRDEAAFALLIVSKNYLKTKWTREEQEIIETVARDSGRPYVLPLRVDDTEVTSISSNVSYKVWDGNAASIALAVFQLKEKYQIQSNRDPQSPHFNSKSADVIKRYDELRKAYRDSNSTYFEKVDRIDQINIGGK